jgi:hypothetical protein
MTVLRIGTSRSGTAKDGTRRGGRHSVKGRRGGDGWRSLSGTSPEPSTVRRHHLDEPVVREGGRRDAVGPVIVSAATKAFGITSSTASIAARTAA